MKKSTLGIFSVIKNIFLGIGLSLLAFSSQAGSVLTAFPEHISASEKYVFYTHGKVLEGNSERPVNPTRPEWGIYDFPAVKQSLRGANYNLIAIQREKNTDPLRYAQVLKQQVEKLIAAGVPANNISLIGFSRGGEITLLAVSALKNPQLNIVILAGCTGSMRRDNQIQLYGNVLSLYETSDEVGSCQDIVKRSTGLTHFQETAISTGKMHGAFFRPDPQWVAPVKRWLHHTSPRDALPAEK